MRQYKYRIAGLIETGLRKWIVVITIITSTVIELIDTTIVNVSINTISGNLGASLEDTAWVITSYAIANVITIPDDHLPGRKNRPQAILHRFNIAVYAGICHVRVLT